MNAIGQKHKDEMKAKRQERMMHLRKGLGLAG